MSLFCSHDWEGFGNPGGKPFHKCKKCDKKENCDKKLKGDHHKAYSSGDWWDDYKCSKCYLSHNG